MNLCRFSLPRQHRSESNKQQRPGRHHHLLQHTMQNLLMIHGMSLQALRDREHESRQHPECLRPVSPKHVAQPSNRPSQVLIKNKHPQPDEDRSRNRPRTPKDHPPPRHTRLHRPVRSSLYLHVERATARSTASESFCEVVEGFAKPTLRSKRATSSTTRAAPEGWHTIAQEVSPG